VAVHDVGIAVNGAAHDMGEREEIAGIGVAPHRHARQAERERRRERAQDFIGLRAAGARVGDDADAVAAPDLLVRQIEHVTEQAADRRAKYM